MSLATRLVVGAVLVLVGAVGVLVTAAELALRQDLEGEVARALEREAGLVREALPADSAAWPNVVRRLGAASTHRVTLIDRAGWVVADSDFPPGPLPPLENHAGRPEVRAALAGGTGVARRRSTSVGRPFLYVAVPGGPGAVRVAASLTEVNATVRGAQGAVAAAALAALAVGGVLALFTARSIARPLTEAAAAARAIAAGAQPSFPHSRIADVSTLVHALRDMHRQLGERFDELRREQGESAALVEAMVEGVIAADARGRVVTANSAARRLLGYDPAEPLPALAELFRWKGARDVVSAALRGGVVSNRELELDSRTVLVNARPLPDGGALLVFHDLTELRRLEAVRRDFVANVSHELKTPLTSISGYAETLIDAPPDAETGRRFLGTILANARRMQRLVDDLLDLARIESGGWRPEPAPVDVAEAAGEAWRALGERGAKDVTFAVQAERGAATVHADPDALRQVLVNLLDNALRYTPPGGRIVCRARVEDGGIAVSVTDTGAGIAGEHLPRIFERFYRADPSRSREHGGTGLGLSIVRHLVEAHGGRVRAESELGRGTTVTCWLPASPAGAPAAGAFAAEARPSHT